MMTLQVDHKYIGMISTQLLQFKRKGDRLYNFRCPFCGDSQKNKFKARGYLFEHKGALVYKCHNCDWTGIVSEEKYHRSNKDFKLVAEKMKLVMKDMNVRPEVEDRLSDLLTIIMWEDELKPLILKKEWEVKQ